MHSAGSVHPARVQARADKSSAGPGASGARCAQEAQEEAATDTVPAQVASAPAAAAAAAVSDDEFGEENVGQWSPAPLPAASVVGLDVISEAEDLRLLQLLRSQVGSSAALWPCSSSAQCKAVEPGQPMPLHHRLQAPCWLRLAAIPGPVGPWTSAQVAHVGQCLTPGPHIHIAGSPALPQPLPRLQQR